MARPRGQNYEKNLFYRTPPHLRGKKETKDPNIKALEPTVEGIQEFRKSRFYPLVKASVGQAIDANNKVYDLLELQKNRKNPIYTDEQFVLVEQGVKIRPLYRIAQEELRNISYSTSLIGAIHQMVSDDVSLYCNYLEDPGFKFKLKDPKAKMRPELEPQFDELGKFIMLMGNKSVQDWRDRERLHAVLEMATRDTLAIDSIAYFKTYNQLQKLIDIRYLDPATILRVDPRKGFRGDRKITHVQMIRNRVEETFEAGRIVYRHKNNLSDIRMRGFGFSPIEQCLIEIMSLLFTVKHNADKFNSRNPPKILISTEGNVSQQDQERLEVEWENSYYGSRDSFKIPFMFGTGKMQVHNLDVSDDFEYDKYLQIVASFIMSAHGVDAAQLGLKLNQTAAISEPSMDGRQNFARDRMHGAMMGFHQDCLNEIIDPSDELDYRLVFSGVKTEDQSKKADLADKQFKTYKSMDMLLKEQDLPTMIEEAEEYFKLGIFSEEEKKKYAKLGALRGNQFFSQAFTNVIAAPQDPGGGLPPGGSQTPTEGGEGDLPWNENDFGQFDEGS